MPNWRKVIVSGSDATLNSLTVTTNVIASSFTGSLQGTATTASYAPSYVPYTGATSAVNLGSQTLTTSGAVGTGALTGTSATFSGAVSSNQAAQGRITTISGTRQLAMDSYSADNNYLTSIGASLYFGTSDANRIYMLANSSVVNTFTSAGKFIINGTTDNGYWLDVNGTGNFTGALTGTSATFSGDVGIGTTSPGAKLDVFGTSRISATTPTQEFYSIGNADVWGSIYAQASGTGSGASLVFSTKRDGNTPTDKLLITQSGDLIINNNNFYKAKNLSGTAYSLAGITSGNIIQIGAIDYISAGVTVAGGDNISFATGGASGTERMKILNTGEVNIASGLWKFTSGGIFEWGNNRGYLTWDTGYAAIRTRSGNRLDLGTDTSGIIMTLAENGNVGIGTTSPTAVIHLKAGTASASTAPFKFTSGTNLTTAEAGAMEWDGTNLFITQTSGPTRKTLAYTSDLGAYLKLDGSTTMTGNLLFSGIDQVRIGNNAASGNSGQRVVFIGDNAGTNNTGTQVIGLGNAAISDNTGSYVVALGGTVGSGNTYDFVNLFGEAASATATAQTVLSKDGSIMARLGYGGLSASRLYTLPDASGTVALVGGAGVGTVTSVAALTLGTTGTDLSSSVANGTTTPVITLNVPDASATARGVITTGTQTIAGAKTFSSALICSSNITATAYYQSSDLRLKNIISTQQSNDGIHTANFTLKSDGKEKWGYIAQEVKEVLPCAVSVSNDDMLTVDYTSVLVYKIAQLEKRIKELENR